MAWFAYPVDQDTQDWIADSFLWAMDEDILTPSTPLILPNGSNSPAPKGAHKDVATALVQAIQGHLGLNDHIIDVEPLDNLPAEYRLDYNSMASVGGTWQSDGTRSLITYDPATLQQPIAFLSTLIHEVMHHRLHQTSREMPGGPEAEELSTDLHCISAGFGIIQMQGAEQAGWQGYLRQETRAHALAVFLGATGQDWTDAAPHLPRRSAKLLRKASAQIAKDEDLIKQLQHGA